MMLRSRPRCRLYPGRLVHPGRPADLGRRAALHPRHGRDDRAQEICRHRRPAGRRSPVPRRSDGHPPYRLLRNEDHLWRAAARRRAQPHRDGDAAEALLYGHRAGPDGAGESGTDRRQPAAGRKPHEQASQGRRGRLRCRRRTTSRPIRNCRTSIRSRRFATSTRQRRRRLSREHGIPASVADFDDIPGASISTSSISARHRRCISSRRGRRFWPAGTWWWKNPSPARSPKPTRLPSSSDETGKQLCPVFQYRFSDGIAQLLHLREAGLVGKAYVATVETHWRRLPAYYDNPWRGRWATELGGCLITHAIHNHDMLTHVLGPARSVFARVVHTGKSDRDRGLCGGRAGDGGRLASPRCR